MVMICSDGCCLMYDYKTEELHSHNLSLARLGNHGTKVIAFFKMLTPALVDWSESLLCAMMPRRMLGVKTNAITVGKELILL